MSFNAFMLVVAAVVNITLALFIFKRSPASSINKSFSLFALNMSLWTGAVFMGVLSRNEASAVFWIRMSFAIAAFMPVSFYIFTTVFPEGGQVKVAYFVFLIGSAVFFILSLGPLLLRGVQLGRTIPKTRYGPVFPVYIGFFLCVTALAFSNLIRKWKNSIGIKRLQIQYVLLGAFLFLLLSSLSNFLAPMMGVEQTEGYGPLFVLVMMGFIVYAIAKYHLMDITIVIKKTTLYLLLTATITIGYIGVVLLSNWLFGGFVGFQTIVPAMIAALLIAFAFAPLKAVIQTFVDKTLFKRRYDHHRILSDLSKILTSIFSLEDLLRLILKVIDETMGIRRGAIYLQQGVGGSYNPIAHIERDSQKSTRIFPLDNSFTSRFKRSGEIILREQLERMPHSSLSLSIVGLLKELDFEVCVPIFSKDLLVGMLFLGSKETGETYTHEDIDMFSTLSNHLAVAIENAQLYTQVEESKKYQELLLDSLTSGVVAVDTEGKITTFNRRAEHILNLETSLVLGKDLDALPPQLRGILHEILIKTTPYKSKEITLGKRFGEITLGLSATLFRSRDNKVLGALVVFSDLTDMKRLEAEMLRAERLASLGTLAAGMAHEIKNPLVSIKTFLELLPKKYGDDEFRESFSQIASGEVDRINKLVEQMLDFSRPHTPVLERVDTHTLIEESLTLLKAEIEKKNIRLIKRFTPNPEIIRGDREQLKLVFLNLFRNSLEAMNDGKGCLEIRTTLVDQEKRKRVRTEKSGFETHQSGRFPPLINIQIKDNGIGISPENMAKLFDPFFTTKAEGTGLGLTIVHRIIKEHGGTIQIKSIRDKTTSFVLELPLDSSERQ